MIETIGQVLSTCLWGVKFYVLISDETFKRDTFTIMFDEKPIKLYRIKGHNLFYELERLEEILDLCEKNLICGQDARNFSNNDRIFRNIPKVALLLKSLEEQCRIESVQLARRIKKLILPKSEKTQEHYYVLLEYIEEIPQNKYPGFPPIAYYSVDSRYDISIHGVLFKVYNGNDTTSYELGLQYLPEKKYTKRGVDTDKKYFKMIGFVSFEKLRTLIQLYKTELDKSNDLNKSNVLSYSEIYDKVFEATEEFMFTSKKMHVDIRGRITGDPSKIKDIYLHRIIDTHDYSERVRKMLGKDTRQKSARSSK